MPRPDNVTHKITWQINVACVLGLLVALFLIVRTNLLPVVLHTSA